jgi:tetratricopeptide (TPR) repeat protein
LLLDKFEEAHAVCNELMILYKNNVHVEIRLKIVEFLSNIGRIFSNRGETKQQVTVIDNLVELCKDSNDTIKIALAKALFKLGVDARKLGNKKKAIIIYGKLVTAFKECNNIDIRSMLVKSLYNQSNCWEIIGELQKAIDTCAELVTLFRSSEDTKIKLIVAKALFKQGICLGKLGKSEEKLTTYKELIKLFKKSNDVEIKSIVGRAIGAVISLKN